MGLKLKYPLASYYKHVDNYTKSREREVVLGFAWYGEKFVNDARDNGTYQDRTSNLRGSIAYDVLKHGESAQSQYGGFGGAGEEAVYAAKTAVFDVVMDEDIGKDEIALIGVAGMEYAAAVESRGYDVITGSVSEENEIIMMLEEAGLV